MTISRARWLAVLIAVLMVATACSSASDEAAATTIPVPTTVLETVEPATTEAEPAATADEPADTTPDTAPTVETTAPPTTEADAGTTDDAVSDEADEGVNGDGTDEPEDEPVAAEPNYENRSADSAFPDSAYLDHDAIRALFPECRAALPSPDWALEHDEYWFKTFENWDTEFVTLNGQRVASGWWTDEQLEMYLPGYGLTAASVRADAVYVPQTDDMLPYSGAPPGEGLADAYWVPLDNEDGTFSLPSLYRRLQTVGYDASASNPGNRGYTLELVRRNDVAGYNTTTDASELGVLMWDWVTYRIQQPPIDEEPTAWGIYTLLETRREGCVAQQMLNICNGEREADSPLLAPSHRIGQALRSLACENER